MLHRRPPVQPLLVTHHSDAGYLTVSDSITSSDAIDPSAQVPRDIGTLAPKHAATLATPLPERSPSPVGKLREAFTPVKRATTTPKEKGDSDAERPEKTGGGGFGGLFAGAGKKKGGSRRGSTSRTAGSTEDLSRQPSPEKPSTPSRIITSIPSTPPNTGDTPTTLVTPPTPTDVRPSTPPVPLPVDPPQIHVSTPPKALSSISSGSSSIRRSRTNPPSKLSNSQVPPLTPTLEEAKTPGGTLTSPAGPGGFFSSVFSAAQSAANQITNTIGTSIPGGAKNKANPADEQERTGQAGGEEVILGSGESDTAQEAALPTEKKQLAIETLGSGNLSLSHLGINEDDPEPMASKADVPDGAVSTPPQAEVTTSAKPDENVSKAALASVEKLITTSPIVSRSDTARPATSHTGEQSPQRPVTREGESVIRRAGSVKSRISDKAKRRRHRGSSATTGNTIAAALGASTAGMANIKDTAGGHRVTGFAIANAKRNEAFHQLFRSVPEDDYLIEDYSAALQRDILLQGRLYISEGHVCFSSNILGWVTNLVISFDEIVSVEKKSTAMIFPNAIVIQTLHARNVFASLVSRDTTYDLLINIWKINHPNLKSSLNGVTLDNEGTGDKTEKTESIGSDDDSDDEGSGDEVYDEDEDGDEGNGSFVETGDGSVAGSEVGELVKAVSRKASAAAFGVPVKDGSAKAIDNAEAINAGTVVSQEYPGPATHAPTECGDEASHLEKPLTDVTIPAPLGKIYSMVFGPASGVFMRKWLVDDQKSIDLQLEPGVHLSPDNKTMSFSYIKPLNASIGPRQTKCIINQTLEQYDLEKAVTVSCSTQTPDVPSGNIFVVKTRYCFMWAPGNQTRLLMSNTIEWSGKSWLKGMTSLWFIWDSVAAA